MDSSKPENRRPQDPDGLILEGWAQGFMVGSLVIMAAITVANMRRHLLLHKLILAEVYLSILFLFSSNTSQPLRSLSPQVLSTISSLTVRLERQRQCQGLMLMLSPIAYTRDGTWNLHICSRSRLRLVSFRHRYWTQYILESSQRDLVDEKSSLS